MSLILGSLEGSAGQRLAAGGGEGRDTKKEDKSKIAEAGGNTATETSGEGELRGKEPEAQRTWLCPMPKKRRDPHASKDAAAQPQTQA
jgi:hypothetical protein